MDRKKEIQAALKRFGIDYTNEKIHLADRYISLILEYNPKINLIARGDEDKIVLRHMVDSLAPVSLLEFKSGAKVMDIGSGAGFPGIPIKIFRQDLDVWSVESTGKKADFQDKAKISLSLKKFCVIHKRLSTKDKEFSGFDYCICRAVSEIRETVKLCKQFLSPFGKIYTFKHINSLDKEIDRFDKSRQCK